MILLTLLIDAIALIILLAILLLIFKFVTGVLKIISLVLVILAILYFGYGITIDIRKLTNNISEQSEYYYNSSEVVKQAVDLLKDIGNFLKNLITSSKSE